MSMFSITVERNMTPSRGDIEYVAYVEWRSGTRWNKEHRSRKRKAAFIGENREAALRAAGYGLDHGLAAIIADEINTGTVKHDEPLDGLSAAIADASENPRGATP